MALFSRPAAAISTILALTTSRYGDVYRLLLASSSLRSAGESSMTNGDLLGTCSSLWWIRNKVTYFIIVFMTGSTKSSTRCRRVPAADGWDPATEGNPNRSPLKRQLAHSGLASDHHPRIASAAGGATCLTAFRKRITVRDGSRVVRAAAPADNRAPQSRHLDMDERVPLVCERCLDGSRSSALPSWHSRRGRRSLSPALPPRRLRIRHPYRQPPPQLRSPAPPNPPVTRPPSKRRTPAPMPAAQLAAQISSPACSTCSSTRSAFSCTTPARVVPAAIRACSSGWIETLAGGTPTPGHRPSPPTCRRATGVRTSQWTPAGDA